MCPGRRRPDPIERRKYHIADQVRIVRVQIGEGGIVIVHGDCADSVKTGLIPLYPFADLGMKEWEYVARHRVVVQRNSITRSRPALYTGWKCTFEMMVTLPEYLTPSLIQTLLGDAGRFCGLGDYRPTYGRFAVSSFIVKAD